MISENIVKEYLNKIEIVKSYRFSSYGDRKIIWIAFNEKNIDNIGLNYPIDESDLLNLSERVNDAYIEEVLGFQDIHQFFSSYFDDWDSESIYPLSYQATQQILKKSEIDIEPFLITGLKFDLASAPKMIFTMQRKELLYYYGGQYVIALDEGYDFEGRILAIVAKLGNPFGDSRDTKELIYRVLNYADDEEIIDLVRSVINMRNVMKKVIHTLNPSSRCPFCKKDLRRVQKILEPDYYWEHIDNCPSRQKIKGRKHKIDVMVTDGENIGNFFFIEQVNEVSALFLRDEAIHRWIKKFNMNISVKEASCICISEIISVVPYKRI